MRTNRILLLAGVLALTASPVRAQNWTLTLDTPDQVAAPGGTAIYTGTITNSTGGPLSLDAGLDFATSPEAEEFTIDFSAGLLAIDLVVPTSGYTGAIFEVSWTSQAIPGSFGIGELVFAAGSPATPGVLEAPFTLGTPTIGPFCPSGVGVAGGGNAIASNDSTDTPAIVYNDPAAGTLVYVTFDGTFWSAATIASGIGTRAAPSLAMDQDLRPHVAFYDEVAGDLVHAWDPGTGWQLETVESTDDVGAEPALVVDGSGDIHVSYYDVTNADLRYARRSGGTWTTGLVEATGDVGLHSAIAADLLGQAFISYYDATSEDLKLAVRSGGSWLTEIVDGTGSRGTSTSIQLREGVVSISYRDATLGSPALRFATGTPGSWVTEIVDSNGDPGLGSSLALNSFGQPRIAYFDAASSEVRFAVKSGGSWAVQAVDTGGTGLLSLNRSAADEPYLSYIDDANGELFFASITTCAVSSVPVAPPAPLLVLQPNRPNPFRESTTFAFALARDSEVKVRVYDAAGRLVAEPFSRTFAAGSHEVTWDGIGRHGRRLASGRYVYEMRVDGERRTGRLVLLK